MRLKDSRWFGKHLIGILNGKMQGYTFPLPCQNRPCISDRGVARPQGPSKVGAEIPRGKRPRCIPPNTKTGIQTAEKRPQQARRGPAVVSFCPKAKAGLGENKAKALAKRNCGGAGKNPTSIYLRHSYFSGNF